MFQGIETLVSKGIISTGNLKLSLAVYSGREFFNKAGVLLTCTSSKLTQAERQETLFPSDYLGTTLAVPLFDFAPLSVLQLPHSKPLEMFQGILLSKNMSTFVSNVRIEVVI